MMAKCFAEDIISNLLFLDWFIYKKKNKMADSSACHLCNTISIIAEECLCRSGSKLQQTLCSAKHCW